MAGSYIIIFYCNTPPRGVGLGSFPVGWVIEGGSLSAAGGGLEPAAGEGGANLKTGKGGHEAADGESLCTQPCVSWSTRTQ